MNQFGIEVKWASFITAFYLAWAFIEKQLGWHVDFSHALKSNLLFFLLVFGMYVLAFLDKKKNDYQNNWSIKDAFKFGMFLTGLLALLNPMVQYIIYQSISPDYFSNIIAYKLAQAPNQLQKENLEALFNANVYLRNGIFDTLSYGVIYSIALAYFLKTKKYTAPQIIQKKSNGNQQNTKNKKRR